MKIRFRLREKLMLITVGIILLAIGINAYLEVKNFIRVYKESIIERVFAQCRELEILIEDVTEMGLGLGELTGLNKECQKLIEAVPYARYCFVMDNDGKVYYHNLSEKVGSVHTDSITRKALKAGEKLVQYFRLDSGERIYDFSVPARALTGDQIGLIRIGILSEIIDKEVSRLRNRAIASGMFFIFIAGIIVFFLAKFSILKPIGCLVNGITEFGKGKLDSRIELKTGDEIGELANSFNQMAEDLQETTVSRDTLIQEVTERKRVEEELKHANEKLTTWVNELEQRTREAALFNQMADLLQACCNVQETYRVITQSAQQLFPADSGALCMFNASRNIVEVVGTWGKSPLGKRVFTLDDCWALRRGKVYRVDHPESELICQHLSDPPSAGYLCVPMIAQGEVLGMLHLQNNPHELSQSKEVRKHLMESKQQMVVTVAEHIALALANLKLRETLRIQSIRDQLTGLFNRRYMEESLEREVSRAERHKVSLGVIMLDLDHFKKFNDTFGHEAGDILLRELGALLQKNIRQEDIACRYGGEEFMLILPEASLDIAQQRAQLLREKVKKSLRVQHRGRLLEAVTISCGVALFPEHGSTIEAVLYAADATLYRAKAEGRDRVMVAQAPD